MSSSLLLRRTAAGARAFSTSPARSLARISIIGNLADTPEVQQTATGRDVIRYAVASNSGPKDNRHTSWFRVSSFVAEGGRRDFMLGLAKGSMVYVDGEITVGQYQDANGQNQRSINIVQRSLEVLKRPASAEQQQEGQ
ncbi:single-strand binding protein family protein [Hirsutella rhossiliensis]|uniref:Single-stranded DNA-binding protein n=1 Tax=Hirsutella rhossiliensis TaxID=111463 RepID=A0A9P8SLC3_9HYPO|nr:single-strand binding protein family domain-containing protein [Hirsutella rhossiliensis]KAH0966811.1 single-strand binding protein family domain-containing protein [Hirsutella rhossiliensis]